MERFWFRAVVAGDPQVMAGCPESAWVVPPDVAAEDVLALYREEAVLAEASTAGGGWC